MNHRYTLDRSPKKHPCPNCGKRRFVLYVDNVEKRYLPAHVGRCDREDNCGHHFTPKMHFEENPRTDGSKGDLFGNTETPPPPPQDLSFIRPEILATTLKGYDQNNFVKFLHSIFDGGLVGELARQFKIGTSRKAWKGATVFWQVDVDLRVRQAKVMLYDPRTGKRLKEDSEPDKGRPKIYFAGKSILRRDGIESPVLRQCLFGEHQLSGKDAGQPVAIVESEKTAIIMAGASRLGFAPECIWLATGGKNGARWTGPEVSKVLEGHHVTLFPDLGAYRTWKEKSAKLTGCRAEVSDMLERLATPTDRKNGLDIADYYLRAFHEKRKTARAKTKTARQVEPKRKKSQKEAPKTRNVGIPPAVKKALPLPAKPEQSADSPGLIEIQGKTGWDIDGLAAFFRTATFPPGKLKLDGHGTITDPQKFIASHLEILRRHNGKETFLPYLRRLEALKALATDAPTDGKGETSDNLLIFDNQ